LITGAARVLTDPVGQRGIQASRDLGESTLWDVKNSSIHCFRRNLAGWAVPGVFWHSYFWSGDPEEL